MSVDIREDTISIVIPWFGRELRGGAELQAWNLAVRLTGRGYAVEVITTCCQSFQADWSENHYSPGLTHEPEGFAVRRFLVEPRDRSAFDRVCGYLLGLKPQDLKPGVSPISPEDERTFCEHLIRCPTLLTYLEAFGWRYSAFIFLPYLYGPILDGLPLVASRSLLEPCLHDEAYAYLPSVQRAVFCAKGLLWLSEGEYELGRRLFGPAVLTKSAVGMAGVEPLLASHDFQEGTPFPQIRPFVLVLGRKDEGKGILLAVEAFRSYCARTGSRLNLVIAGPGELSLADPEHNIHDLGLVSESIRCWLLQHTLALLQPSPNESFSRVIFEAWQCKKPVIARRSCLATACAVRACEGGWLAETVEEWSDLLHQLEAMTMDQRHAVGLRGATYCATIADWERVMDRYEEVLRPFVRRVKSTASIRFALSTNRPQRVRLLSENREIGAWDLRVGEVHETDWLEQHLPGAEPVLRLESDQAAGHFPPDPRRLGFYLKSMEVRSADMPEFSLRFARGWNRSECPPGTVGPRWSTGSAEVVVSSPKSPGGSLAIHQVLPNLGYGDAIGNHTIWIRDQLQAMGFVSEIFARHIAPEMLGQAYPLSSQDSLPPDATILYHHSIGTEITPWVCQHAGPKGLIYHNITPAEFFEPYDAEIARICRHGREELLQLAPYFPVSAGDSDFNAKEIAASGFQDPSVLPLCIDPNHWGSPPDPRIMAELQDGRTNVLFVGRLVPNKRHEELIYTFKSWLKHDPEARLFLVGTGDVSSFYSECLQELARRLQVEHAVHFVGHVNEGQLQAYYRCASMFWCFSQHEGFCVPLIEAMWFDVPVLACAATVVPETLAGAGCLFEPGENPAAIVNLAGKLQTDQAFRTEIIASQRKRRTAFLADGVRQHLVTLVDRLRAVSTAEISSHREANSIGSSPVGDIAVVKLDHIGDLLLATPVFAALKRRFPAATITAVVSSSAASILHGNPHVDHIVTYDAPWLWREPPVGVRLIEKLKFNAVSQRALLHHNYDLLVNLRSDHYNVPFAASIPHRYLLSYTNDSDYEFLITHPLRRTIAMHASEQHRHLLASIGANQWSAPTLYPSAADQAAVDAVHDFAPGTVALFTGAGIPLKKWPAAKFKELTHRLRASGVPVVLIGSKDEEELATQISGETGAVNLCARFSLLELAVALSRCAVLVSNDSAPGHIAAAVGSPVICIIRPSVREEFAPLGPNHYACCAENCEMPCGGFDPSAKADAIGVCACIEGIAVEDVLEATLSRLPVTKTITVAAK